MNSRVFIGQDLGFDYSDAETFGKLRYLVPKGVSAHNHARVRSTIRKVLWDEKFSSDDYLLCSGSPALLMQAAIEASRLAPSFGVLVWDNRAMHYKKVTAQ